MGNLLPATVLELGAGHGALTAAVARHWTGSKLITVDTDVTVAAGRFVGDRVEGHTHHVHDALDEELGTRIGLDMGSVDAAVCNPPYVRPRWRKGFAHILEDAGLSGALDSVHDASADLLFVAQNLRLLKPHGRLGLVLPDGLITGEKYAKVRSTLLKQHRVEQVIQLNRRTFSNTEAQTYLLVLSNRSGETASVCLRKMNADGSLSAHIDVDQDRAKVRLDFKFHSSYASTTNSHSTRRLGDIVTKISRGTVNSKQIATSPTPIFHLGDFPPSMKGDIPVVDKKFLLEKNKIPQIQARTAVEGDVLIARIGRHLAGKACLVPSGGCVISDCVFSLEVAPHFQEKLIRFLLSDAGIAALGATAHGVGARYISKSDVLNLPIPF